jgi:hypothetical protein
MKRLLPIRNVAALMAMTCGIHADILERKNGTILDGKYAGGTAGTVRFETSAGVQVIQTGEIIALTFTAVSSTAPAPAAASPPAATAPPSAVAPAAQPQSVTLPAGATLMVRTLDNISSRNRPGTPFSTRLEYDLSAGNTIALKGGTVIYGQIQSATQAGRVVGQSALDLRLTQVVVNGQTVPLMTSGHRAAGQSAIAKTAKSASAGAAIGAVGRAAVRGQTIGLAQGTLLEFTLMQPVTIPVSQQIRQAISLV